MYQIIKKKRAKKFLEKLPNGEDIKALKGYDNLLRLRVGEYRIIYTVNNGECVILVIDAGNRGEIYKRY